ncbi:MAG: Spy/CpxP family protein refolding chaperone [Gemmatimonadota bacterium]|jgi:hypothetical protein
MRSTGPRPPSLALCAAILALAASPPPLHAQHGAHSPYAGSGSEEVQTLTPQEVAGLLEGEGMGLARPAELNGYPGPRHVLDLADSLRLSDEQRRLTQETFDAMQERAAELGRRIVDEEKALDAGFAAAADAAALEARVREVGRLRAELRWTHLAAHLRMVEILSVHQRHEYDRLRGYGGHTHG